jgi:FdrA protein
LITAHEVFESLYRDSVALMALSAQLEGMPGVDQVSVVMATPTNLEILQNSGMLPEQLDASPDDLLVVARVADQAQAADVIEAARAGLLSASEESGSAEETRPATIDEGLAVFAADLVAVSTPGEYAPMVAERALQRGLHVFCFSDNVSVADEVRLKKLAVSKHLLMMGPDCGTAFLDGVPLGFMNRVRRATVGMIGASGTGAQEIAVLLDRAGLGLSQLIGVGGHDLSADVNGIMTDLALDMLLDDEQTETIIVVSKPPHPEVARKLMNRLAQSPKPAVACLLGEPDADGPVPVRGTLEAAAREVAALYDTPLPIQDTTIAPNPDRPSGLLALYTGGTLAGEATVITEREGVAAEILDLGDDQYTRGRPHPMIDPGHRAARLAEVGQRADVGTVLLDCVLGHAAHLDPATPIADAARTAIATARQAGRDLQVVASVCGTDQDPQGLAGQRRILAEAGVVVVDSNAAAVRAAIDSVRGAR